MKKIFLLLSVVLLASCEEDTSSNVSRVTYYPNFEVLGDDVIFVPKGSEYTDPGVNVTEGGTTIDYTTTVQGQFRGGTSIDTNVDDIYTVTYSATNVDGFSGTATRTVIVYENGDLVNSIAGLYRSTVTRNGTLTAQYTDMEYVLIWSEGGNEYGISDGIGGYYAIGRAYGNGYAAPATIIANNIPANDFTIPDFEVGTFGGVVSGNTLTVNPATQTLVLNNSWDAGYVFNVVLEQVQP